MTACAIGQPSMNSYGINFLRPPLVGMLATAISLGHATADDFIRQPRLQSGLAVEGEASDGSCVTPDEMVSEPDASSQAEIESVVELSVAPRPNPVNANQTNENDLQWVAREAVGGDAWTDSTLASEDVVETAYPAGTTGIEVQDPVSLPFDTTPALTLPAGSIHYSERVGRELLYRPSSDGSHQAPVPATEPQVAHDVNTTRELPQTINNEATVHESGPKSQLVSILAEPRVLENEMVPQVQAPPSEAIPGWQAVGQRLSNHLTRCESLVRRSAFYSALEETELAAVHLIRVLDLMGRSHACEQNWMMAQRAFSEADDFASTHLLADDTRLFQRIVQSHETPVLKGEDLGRVSPLAAAESYRQYAVLRLVEASHNHPWASEVYYGIGRVWQAMADTDGGQDAMRQKAAAYYRAAHAIAPYNSMASNQLGFLLLQMDRPADAMVALTASVNSAPVRSNLQNLAEASRRLGDQATYQWALSSLANMEIASEATPSRPSVTEVDPQTFAAISPYSGSPQARSVPAVQAAYRQPATRQ